MIVVNFERGKDPKQTLGIGEFIYDNGFGLRKYVCTKCKGTRLQQKMSGGFSPPYYICYDCGEIVYAPSWINIETKEHMRAKTINENINFERDIDPKSSLRIGKSNQYPYYHEFMKIYNFSSVYEGFSEVSEIDFDNKEPYFHIVSAEVELRSSQHHLPKEYQEYTLYLTEDEGISFWIEKSLEKTNDEYFIYSLDEFKRILNIK